MTAPPPSFVRVAERFIVDFFGAPTTGEAVALFRIVYGLLACWGALGVWVNLDRYFGAHGIVPYDLVKADAYQWMGLFYWAPNASWLPAAHAVAFSIAAVLVTIGVYPRPMALVICYVNISLQFRNPFILNSGDRLFQIAAGLAVLMPLARRWSVAALWRARRGLPPLPTLPIYGQRLMQLQLAYVYISSGISKLSNERWRHGMALRDVLSSPVFSEWPHYWGFLPFIGLLTWGTITFEIGFPLVVWFKKVRPWALLAGIAFHLGIDLLMIIPIFSAIMLACYPLYLTDGEAIALVTRLRRGFSRRPVLGADA